mgnify:CR=1 FL=1
MDARSRVAQQQDQERRVGVGAGDGARAAPGHPRRAVLQRTHRVCVSALTACASARACLTAPQVWDGEESELAQVHNALGFCYFNMEKVREPGEPGAGGQGQGSVGGGARTSEWLRGWPCEAARGAGGKGE